MYPFVVEMTGEFISDANFTVDVQTHLMQLQGMLRLMAHLG